MEPSSDPFVAGLLRQRISEERRIPSCERARRLRSPTAIVSVCIPVPGAGAPSGCGPSMMATASFPPTRGIAVARQSRSTGARLIPTHERDRRLEAPGNAGPRAHSHPREGSPTRSRLLLFLSHSFPPTSEVAGNRRSAEGAQGLVTTHERGSPRRRLRLMRSFPRPSGVALLREDHERQGSSCPNARVGSPISRSPVALRVSSFRCASAIASALL